MVICFEPLVSPTATLPKSGLPGWLLKMNRFATPVPLSANVSVPAAPSSTVSVLESLPVELGLYCTPNVQFCPSARVPVQLSLTIENAPLLPVSSAITASAPLPLVIFSCWVGESPVATRPKLRSPGFTATPPAPSAVGPPVAASARTER